MKINVVGLGSGSLNSISMGAYWQFHSGQKLYARTLRHPIFDEAEFKNLSIKSFDSVYESSPSFEAAYQNIVNTLISEVQKHGELLYAVPGHPRVAESTVDLLLAHPLVQSGAIETELYGSGSFLDDLFVFLNLDPVHNGFVFLDALNIQPDQLSAHVDFVFTQVFNRHVASDLKLTLLEQFDPETAVVLFKGAGIPSIQEKRTVSLYALDQNDFAFDHLTSLYIPYSPENQRYHSLSDLHQVMRTLRSDHGCPWDRKQTPESLMRHIKDEVDELQQAIEKDDIENIIEELGDVLMLLVMQAQIGSEMEYFDLYEVIDGVTKKMIFRHPHIFGGEKAESLEDANLLWERQKQREKSNKA